MGPTAAHTEPGEALLGGSTEDRFLFPDSGVTKLTQCLAGVTGACLGLGALFPGKGANLGGCLKPHRQHRFRSEALLLF